MATLAELRAYVRTQTDTLEADLPDDTINNYLREAFNRTVNAETNWPFYEKIWTGTQLAGNNVIEMPTDCQELVSIVDTNNNRFRLTQIDFNEAEDQYFRVENVTGYPIEFSIWNDIIYLWPRLSYDADRNYQLRGYREPTNWVAGAAATTQPDCDSRLHYPLCHYAVALAYAQQEAPELERVYMERWQRDVEMARQLIMSPRHHLPLVMGPNRITRIGAGRYRPSFTIDTP